MTSWHRASSHRRPPECRTCAGNWTSISTSSRSLPRQRIEHQHAHSVRLHLRCNIVQSGTESCRSEAGRLRVLARRVHVVDVNARARQDVVELVEQDLLPGRIEVLPADTSRQTACRSTPASPRSSISTSFLRLPFFVFRLRGLHAAVILEVELAVPRRNLQLALVLAPGRRRNRVAVEKLQLRIDNVAISASAARCQDQRASGRRRDRPRRRGTSCRKASGRRGVRAAVVLLHRRAVDRRVARHLQRINRVGVVAGEVGQQLAAVGRLPPEEAIGKRGELEAHSSFWVTK